MWKNDLYSGATWARMTNNADCKLERYGFVIERIQFLLAFGEL